MTSVLTGFAFRIAFVGEPEAIFFALQAVVIHARSESSVIIFFVFSIILNYITFHTILIWIFPAKSDFCAVHQFLQNITLFALLTNIILNLSAIFELRSLSARSISVYLVSFLANYASVELTLHLTIFQIQLTERYSRVPETLVNAL